MAQVSYEHKGEWNETIKVSRWGDWGVEVELIPDDTVNGKSLRAEIETKDIPHLIGWLNEAYLSLINTQD